MMRILVTGTAGFIGFHTARRLLADGHEVVGFDGVTPYYDPRLKQARHRILAQTSNRFRPVEAMLEDKDALARAVAPQAPEVIIHLAAQAGVRYSITNPDAYISANLAGTFNVLELARRTRPTHLLLASTSSVYGGNPAMPFAETDRADWPLTLYAASKKSVEAMSHSYAHLWDIPVTCARFFTVYGPWGRPDMALFKFAEAIESGAPIEIYGDGSASRDWTYIDDVVEALMRLMTAVPEKHRPLAMREGQDSLSPVAPWRAVNVGRGQPVSLAAFIETLERSLGKPAQRRLLPMQQGDPSATFADTRLLTALTGFTPRTGLDEGVRSFVAWYRQWRESAG